MDAIIFLEKAILQNLTGVGKTAFFHC